VYGEVRGADGALRGDAVVEVVTFHDTCDAERPAIQGVPTPAPDGKYRRMLRGAHFLEFRACLVVNAVAPSPDDTLRGSVRDQMITMRSVSIGPPDSIRIDVVVRAP